MVNTVIKNEYRKKITVFVTMNEYIKKKIWKYFQKRKELPLSFPFFK